MFCAQCGKKNTPGSNFCLQCGQPLTNAPKTERNEVEPWHLRQLGGKPKLSSAEDSSSLYKNSFIIVALLFLTFACGYLLFENYRDKQADTSASNISSEEGRLPNTTPENPNLINDEIVEEKKVDFAKIENILADEEQNGEFSVYIQDLKSGCKYYTANADQPFVAAGSIFPVISWALQSAVAENAVAYHDTVRIRDSMLVGGTGILAKNDTGKYYSIGELEQIMLLHSDNTAANILIDHIGGIDAVNRYIQEPFENAKLNRYLMDSNAIDKGIENYLSAQELGLIISGCKINNAGLSLPQADMSAYIPANCLVYHQVGLLTNIYNEAFLVCGENAEFVVAVMSRGTSHETAKQIIGKILQFVYYDLEI